jgi:hypothetical protein
MNETITIEKGSGNVFADLGYPNAEEMLTKARLAQRITEILEQIIQASLLPLASQFRRGVNKTSRCLLPEQHNNACLGVDTEKP